MSTKAQSDRQQKSRCFRSSISSTSSRSCPSNRSCKGQAISKKNAHSLIERRYRTNLNNKIAVLCNRVPSLQSIGERATGGKSHVVDDLYSSGTPTKLNKVQIFSNLGSAQIQKDKSLIHLFSKKATIISKATEYIAYLERCKDYLDIELQVLKGRIDTYKTPYQKVRRVFQQT